MNMPLIVHVYTTRVWEPCARRERDHARVGSSLSHRRLLAFSVSLSKSSFPLSPFPPAPSSFVPRSHLRPPCGSDLSELSGAYSPVNPTPMLFARCSRSRMQGSREIREARSTRLFPLTRRREIAVELFRRTGYTYAVEKCPL